MFRKQRARSFAPAGGSANESGRVVRFFRRFQRFHGGHLKVHDYFQHVAKAPGFTPVVTFDPGSSFDATNPWAGLQEVDAPPADVLFLAGRDWPRVPPKCFGDGRVPVINLIQHLRHTDPSTDLYTFLERRAVRICVGPELGEAIVATGRANGPVVVIPDGIDVDAIAPLAPLALDDREVDVVVVATKKPDLGRRLAGRLGASADVLTELLPRETFLERIGRARIALFLPNDTEGFYLPALEAMGLGTLVVCPDCGGNRSFCLDGTTAFRPSYDDDALVDAVERARGLSPEACATMTRAAMTTARDHDLVRERQRFHDVLANLSDLWDEGSGA